MPLRGAAQSAKECSVGKEYKYIAAFRVVQINRAAAIHGDARGVAHASVLKRKQGSSPGLEFIDEAGFRVGNENATQAVRGEGHGRIKLSRTSAFISPCAEEFKGRRCRRFWSRFSALAAGSQEQDRGHERQQEFPSNKKGIRLRHAQDLGPAIF